MGRNIIEIGLIGNRCRHPARPGRPKNTVSIAAGFQAPRQAPFFRPLETVRKPLLKPEAGTAEPGA
jgi:hypothetical protein